MKIALLVSENFADLNEILSKALWRSFTHSQIESISQEQWNKFTPVEPKVWVIADAKDAWTERIIHILSIAGSKVVLLGRIPARLAVRLGVSVSSVPAESSSYVSSAPAEPHHSSQSKAVICYRDTKPHLGIDSPIMQRPCLRYDFTDEWNNLGYGAIRADGSMWALAQKADWQEQHLLATVENNGNVLSGYAALWKDKASLLWFNRPVGPVDSQEWRLIERYISSYDHPASICLPVMCEIPAGFAAAVTMRLDCDEDIASAEPLFNLYQSEHVPFSLAVTTRLMEDAAHLPLLRAVVASGGSLLSHSATHPVNWGGSYEAAFAEATVSRAAFAQVLGSDVRIDYAVSPFHQNPPYAVVAMADAGFLGFVGGLVRNDPEYLIARAGGVLFGPEGFISHSQQCMLHGDSMLSGNDPLAVFKESFDNAVSNGALFGYLDHPFSPRYQYGWESETQRIQMHREFIAYMRNQGRVLFLSQNDLLDWVCYKSSVNIHKKEDGFYITSPLSSQWKLKIEFAGNESVPEKVQESFHG